MYWGRQRPRQKTALVARLLTALPCSVSTATNRALTRPERLVSLFECSVFVYHPALFCVYCDQQAVQQYLVSELSSRDKTREELFATEPTPPRNSPQQRNSSDCGVLMLHVMEVGRGSGRCVVVEATRTLRVSAVSIRRCLSRHVQY